jgi:hypothetical protein
MIAFNFSRRGLFRRLLAAAAAPFLPRTAHSADGDREPRFAASYLFDYKGRVISATYTISDGVSILSNL